jgi:gamma-glutamyl:cysteine ligase YbdK (ATP-grasp superfamily)
MSGSDLAAAVEDVLAVDASDFRSRAEDEAEVIKRELDAGTFDNPQAIVGLEYEFYGVNRETSELARVPRRLLEFIGFEKELGLHNAEMCTSPQPLNSYGLAAQEAEVNARLRTALDCVRSSGLRLVSDGMWTIPPEGEPAGEYLSRSVEDRGVRIASNMSDSVRYHAMANTAGADAVGMNLDAPHVSHSAKTVMPESLITSIQPHYQVSHAADLPDYFRYALRIAGPLLALGVNSPFFPPNLYDDAPAERIVEDAWMSHRIHVFEAILNPNSGTGKVRFPRDLDSTEQAADRIAADDTIVPMPIEESNRFDDAFATFRQKHGTYWRWVRPVFEGSSKSAANARIEFRPIAGQPTVRDTIAFQAAFAGLMESLTRREHPVASLDWQDAHGNFYAAMHDGLDADLTWVTNDGRETTTYNDIYADIFDHAKDGLTSRGLSEDEAAKYLWPLRQRARHKTTPADWKRHEVQKRLDDGDDLAAAIHGMQRAYIDRQTETIIGDSSFADWIAD